MFSTGMKNKWPERHYVDLFAGSGFAKLRDGDEVVCASPAIAANVPDTFTCLHLCERNTSFADSLSARLRRIESGSRFRVLCGDANELIEELLSPIPTRGALCVTFADPYGLHLDFETVRRIASIHSDLIILLADNMDALRNWAAYYRDNPSSNLDRFMGEPGWRDEFETAAEGGGFAQRFRTRYEDRLKTLGYRHFAHERVASTAKRDIYTLLYASRHPTGLRFWRSAASVDEEGQRALFDA